MTQDEIIEGNKCIAEFMGANVEQLYSNNETQTGIIATFEKGAAPDIYRNYSAEHLKYYSSWDWLMPIVEKIESLHTEHDGYFGVHINSNGCAIQGTKLRLDKKNPHYCYFNDVTHESKKSATWLMVVEFIKWYNSQQNKPQ